MMERRSGFAVVLGCLATAGQRGRDWRSLRRYNTLHVIPRWFYLLKEVVDFSSPLIGPFPISGMLRPPHFRPVNSRQTRLLCSDVGYPCTGIAGTQPSGISQCAWLVSSYEV